MTQWCGRYEGKSSVETATLAQCLIITVAFIASFHPRVFAWHPAEYKRCL